MPEPPSLPVQVVCTGVAVTECPEPITPANVETGASSAGAVASAAATTGLGFDSAEGPPSAVTRSLSRRPASSGRAVYARLVAREMAVQAAPAASQLSHW